MIGLGTAVTNAKKDPAGAPFVAGSADNGLSIDPVTGRAVLGNNVTGAAGAAQLITDREIWTNTLRLLLTDNSGGTDFQATLSAALLGVLNNTDQDDTNMQPGRLFINSPVNDDPRLRMIGSNTAVLFLNQIDVFAIRSEASIDSAIQVYLLTDNTRIGPGADNGSKLQVNGNISMLSVTNTLDFPSTNAGESSDLTIPFGAAVEGDMVVLGVPAGSTDPNSCFTAFVTPGGGSVTVRFNNYQLVGAIDPASGDFTVSIFKSL